METGAVAYSEHVARQQSEPPPLGRGELSRSRLARIVGAFTPTPTQSRVLLDFRDLLRRRKEGVWTAGEYSQVSGQYENTGSSCTGAGCPSSCRRTSSSKSAPRDPRAPAKSPRLSILHHDARVERERERKMLERVGTRSLRVFDVKGSSVNRHAAEPREGERVVCRSCNQRYRFSRTAQQARAGGVCLLDEILFL